MIIAWWLYGFIVSSIYRGLSMANPLLTNQHTGMTEDEQDETWQIQNLAMDASFRDCPGTNMVLGFIFHFSTFITVPTLSWFKNQQL